MTDRRARYSEALVRQAEKQGATVTMTKAGAYRVRTTSGKVIVLHRTPGDSRHWKNLRSKWEGHGLIWPFNSTNL